MLAFVVASFFAGLGGALYAHYLSTVNPNQFDVSQMVYVVIWTIVGGTTRIYGPILGVIALTILDEIVLRAIGIDTDPPAALRRGPDPDDPVSAEGTGKPGHRSAGGRS